MLTRCPAISWQFLVNNKLGADLDAGNMGKYDQLVQACLATGAHCMIDIHNFARWDGSIIGQGGPTDEQFARLWSQLATRYASSDHVVFELMNEPHDLDVAAWARTCQAAVTAIRAAGATAQTILLPGSNFDSAATLTDPVKGGAAALMAVTNPDGGTDGLLLDIHKYLDVDNSGTHAECVTDNVAALAGVADFLRRAGRKGLVSETGASSDATCIKAFCAQNAFVNANSDVFVGLVAWAAGGFDGSYLLSLTPSRGQGGGFVDNELAAQCVVKTWLDSNETVSVPVPTATATTGRGTGTRTGTRTATGTRRVTMTEAPTGSTVMIVTMTGTALNDEPTTLLMDPGAPTLPLDSSPPAPGLTTSIGTAASPSETVVANWVGRMQVPGALLVFVLLGMAALA